jgi:MoaE-MoaD fusion protein
MTVTVRLFAILRQRAGRDSIDVELEEGATVAEALEELSAQPELGELLGRLPVRMAVNRDYAEPDTRLSAGDELALVPPVSGGEFSRVPVSGGEFSRVHVRITEQPLSLISISGLVSRPEAGAIVTFQGTTREVSRLEYEAYVEMAEERIDQILRECVARHGLAAAAAEHRIGAVPLGESSVIVAVSAAHREEAFAGAREAIDRIKAEAPIWKREVEEAGTSEQGRWVEGAIPPARAGEGGSGP